MGFFNMHLICLSTHHRALMIMSFLSMIMGSKYFDNETGKLKHNFKLKERGRCAPSPKFSLLATPTPTLNLESNSSSGMESYNSSSYASTTIVQ